MILHTALLLLLLLSNFTSSYLLVQHPVFLRRSFLNAQGSVKPCEAAEPVDSVVDRGIFSRRCILAAICASSQVAIAAEDRPPLVFREISSGVKIAEIELGNGLDNVVEASSKVTFHVVGRLAGRQGWVFENSQLDDDPYRLDLSLRDAVVAGLAEGMQGMRVGGKRRIVVPSAQGYINRVVEPVPRDYGNRNRLYSTVLNSNRQDQERKALGADLTGVVVFDVSLLRIR
jgi:hypothetical protein